MNLHKENDIHKRVYRYITGKETFSKEFDVSGSGNIDCLKHNLKDFIQGEGIDNLALEDRLDMLYSFMNNSKERKYYQYRRVSVTGSGPVMMVQDRYTNKTREMINLASNDYLNLTKHPRVVKAGIQALKKYGTGAGSVPLLAGTLDIHRSLEKRVAEFKGCEASIIFTSGFGSNVAALSTLLRKNDVAILDMLAHASLIEGCKETNKMFFRHNNMQSLQRALQRANKEYVNKIVVVDGVYSMDGDIAPLDDIVTIAHEHGALVMVDEAHATGVIGKNGRGTPEHFNIQGKVDIVAGTFSKALGGVGGFVAASKKAVKYLELLARPYMFSTAPTPAVVASLIEALNVVEEESDLRAKLWRNIRYFKENLQTLGFNIGNAETAIFPIIIGDTYKVYEMCRKLHESGIYANPVVYPAVPARLSRIRISLTSGLEKGHLDKALEALEYYGRELVVI